MLTSINTNYVRIIQRLRGAGYRITPQRKIILQTLLENTEATCKELCYFVKQRDGSISPSSVYRTVNNLEELGVLSKRLVLEAV